MQETRTRTYRGWTTRAAQDSFAADAASASGEGFVPADQRWIGQNELVVTYARQVTPAAPGPQRGLALLGSVLLGVVVGFVVWLLLGLVIGGLISVPVGSIVGTVVAFRRSRRSGWVSFIVMFVAVLAILAVVALTVSLALLAFLWANML